MKAEDGEYGGGELPRNFGGGKVFPDWEAEKGLNTVFVKPTSELAAPFWADHCWKT